MKASKSDITLELECWVEDLSPAQLAAYEKVANEHNAIKNALKNALSANEGKELFNGQVFQAYSFKGKVLQELKEATVPKKPPKAETTPSVAGNEKTYTRSGRKRPPNFVYLESSDEEDDDVPLAKRIANANAKQVKGGSDSSTPAKVGKKGSTAPLASTDAKKDDVATPGKVGKIGKDGKAKAVKTESESPTAPSIRPSEDSAVGGLIVGTDNKDGKGSKENKEGKLQGKTFPSLVVLAKPWLKVKDMSATRNKLDSKVKLVLMLTPNKFTEWLIQEGLLKAEQKCANHKTNDLKLGVYSDASKFPYTGGYVWISECCPTRFVSVFHGSIFEGAPHPPSCILKLVYHWACQTNIQNVVQWVKVDNVYIKGVYTWLRAICTLAVHQKCKKLGGPEKFVEVGVISFGTTSQDGQQRQLKVEVLGVLDYAEKTIRLRAVEPLSDSDRNYKKRFQVILEPLQRWVHKDSTICIDLTVDKMTLYSMGFKNVVQAAATDSSAKHTNSAVMDYLRRIVPRMFQNTLSLLSRQMIQQFLDELVWREQFGTYALQAFNNITAHIAEQTRINCNESLTQRLYHVATNPFKDWSVLPANAKEIPANTTPKRLKKPINEADYVNEKVNVKNIKKEKDDDVTPATSAKKGPKTYEHKKISSAKNAAPLKSSSKVLSGNISTKKEITNTESKKIPVDGKPLKKGKEKDDDELRGLEEMYYGVQSGSERCYEEFPLKPITKYEEGTMGLASHVECPICDTATTFDSNETLQTHLVSHINIDGKNHTLQCLFCLEKTDSESSLTKHNSIMHPEETKSSTSASYRCLICQQRFNSLNFLTSHLQNKHSMLELPYYCQACGYRTSSHRDAVRHYYDDHKHHNFLQCPHCLDIYRFAYKGQVNQSNIENYYMHLRQHMGKKDPNLKCTKCTLSFLDKGALKQHVSNHHNSLWKNATNVRKLLKNSMLIQPPKVRSHHREPLPFTVQSKLGEFFAFIDGSICAECNMEILNEQHFTGNLKCNKCNFKTSCERAMFQHTSDCNGPSGTKDVMEMPLPNEMHCICGFSTANGNNMAYHLATCGQKSAYPTLQMAQENTVKRNMLDMLGLVKRDGETGGDIGDQNTNISGAMGSHDVSEDQQVVDDNQASEDNLPQSDDVMDTQSSSIAPDQTPIPFGQMDATPVDQQQQANQHYGHIVDSTSHLQTSQQYLGFSQNEVAPHALNAADIDMPLIGELAEPSPLPTPQFLGEVHTPMFDPAQHAEQQHYQMIQQHMHQQQ
ncbi:zinc finger domain-containing protein relative of woc [Haematobia irritans]|uniref:zinc finger domain-containing protein relative of woc n=1 Tax=Haematobia irritans TaxID=7368 RepID=UPI003F508D25